MSLWEYPCFKWKSWGKWRYNNKISVFTYYTVSVSQVLSYNITVYTPLLKSIVVQRAVQLLSNELWYDWKGYKLGVGMLKRCPCLLPMVLEYKNIFKSLVFSLVYDPVPECPENILNLIWRHIFQCSPVIWGFYNYLMGAYPIHLVKYTFSHLVQPLFYLQGRKLIWNNPQFPSCLILIGTTMTVCKDFRWCFVFIAIAEWTEFVILLWRRDSEICWSFTSVCRYNDPSSDNWVFS